VTMPPSEGEASSAQGIAWDRPHREWRAHRYPGEGRAFMCAIGSDRGPDVRRHRHLAQDGAVYDEEFVEGEPVPDPEAFLAALTRSRLSADTSPSRRSCRTSHPRYGYYRE